MFSIANVVQVALKFEMGFERSIILFRPTLPLTVSSDVKTVPQKEMNRLFLQNNSNPVDDLICAEIFHEAKRG